MYPRPDSNWDNRLRRSAFYPIGLRGHSAVIIASGRFGSKVCRAEAGREYLLPQVQTPLKRKQ